MFQDLWLIFYVTRNGKESMFLKLWVLQNNF